MFQIAMIALVLSALPYPPQDDGGAPAEAHAQASLPALDWITVPDGTPLNLELANEVSSATAKPGDTVGFTTAHSLRINGLMVVPKGTAVSGTVVQVKHSRRPSKDSEVKVAAETLNLLSGDLATLRQAKSGNQQSKNKTKEVAPHMGEWQMMSADIGTPGPAGMIIPLLMLATKGREWVYPAGTRTIAYLNGPVKIDRGALVNLQPPPYKGPAQVFFRARQGKSVKLFCGDKIVHELFYPIRLELNPGTYSFSTGKPSENAVQLEVQQDHLYLIDREHKKLVARNSDQYWDEIEELNQIDMGDYYFPLSSTDNMCTPTPLP